MDAKIKHINGGTAELILIFSTLQMAFEKHQYKQLRNEAINVEARNSGLSSTLMKQIVNNNFGLTNSLLAIDHWVKYQMNVDDN